MKREEREVLGIVGGLGPMASAEFLKTVYEYGIGENEQDAPIVLMYSDPTFPDRTESFLAGESIENRTGTAGRQDTLGSDAHVPAQFSPCGKNL